MRSLVHSVRVRGGEEMIRNLVVTFGNVNTVKKIIQATVAMSEKDFRIRFNRFWLNFLCWTIKPRWSEFS
jgi:hypothetical protein